MARAVIGGAGLAGLACALKLCEAGVPVTVLEQARHAGGRCRSYHDKVLDRIIDNGNHLLLSGNRAALAYLASVDAEDRLTGPDTAAYPFLDAATGERWTVRPGKGRLPWWVFDAKRRVAGTTPRDYLSIARLMKRNRGKTLAQVIGTQGALYARFWDPFVVAVLNTAAPDAAAELIAPVLWETFARGAHACRPLIARDGLSDTFIAPAVAELERRGAAIRFGQRIAQVHTEANRVTGLTASGKTLALGPADVFVSAVPAPVAADLLPAITAPDAFSPIVNLHFRLDTPQQARADNHFMGLVNATAQWLFVRGDIASVTISAADAVADLPKEDLAARVWREVALALGLGDAPVPLCQVIKERRATFLQTPEQVARRPGAQTRWHNLVLAGDWTDTGVPATIEGAIRSGHAAAAVALTRLA
jgi:squalene-associated FAD-dependent desaturase